VPVKLRTATGRLAVGIRLVAAAVTVSAALSGCGAGQRAQTANEFSVVDGAAANVGAMAIRNAGVSSPTTAVGYAAGSSVTLSMTVANNGDGSDTLVSVTTPDASSTKVLGPASAPSFIVPSNGAIVVGSTPGTARITLTGLKYRLVPGQLVPVTLSFKVAGEVTVQMPVKLAPNQTGGETVDVEPPTRASI
jgi:copper(I)-binding protein